MSKRVLVVSSFIYGAAPTELNFYCLMVIWFYCYLLWKVTGSGQAAFYIKDCTACRALT